MLQSILRASSSHSDANAVRDQREHMRSPLHELLHIGNARQAVSNNALILAREMSLSTQLLDVITISLSRRNAPRRSMRLFQESRIRQISHYIPNRSRAKPLAARSSERPRSHRLPAGNKCLNDGGEDFAFASAGWPCWHISPKEGQNRPIKYFRCSGLD